MLSTKHTRAARTTIVTLGIVSLIVAIGFAVRIPLLAEIWPLGDTIAVDSFLGAYLAGVGASLLWIGVSGDLGAIVAGALSLAVLYTSLAIAWFRLSFGATPGLRPTALVCGAAALFSAGLALWSRRIAIRDAQPLPRFAAVAFVVYVLLLGFVGGALLLRRPNVFPLPLGPAAAALVGSAFLGSTAYFLYSLARPFWRNACSQLWGFLAYDLVLILPLISRIGVVDAAHRPALLLNIAVLVFSGVLAIYFLLIAPATRVWSGSPARNISEAAPLKAMGVAKRKTASVVRARLAAK
jgi:hypothetical protein